MANSFFQFKQFRVEQENCGMKVCTDACILGAFTKMPQAKSVLDIGTGTALLSLMLAQNHPSARIDAVEIEKEAVEQARTNIANSPWKVQIKVYNTAIQDFSSDHLYDLIICNPPFYPDHLRSANPKRRQAFHQDTISFPELVQAVERLLAPDGLFSLLLPARQAEEFALPASKAGLFLQQELRFYEHANSKQYRSISIFSFKPTADPVTEKLIIRSENGSYSRQFKKLLQPYYTIF